MDGDSEGGSYFQTAPILMGLSRLNHINCNWRQNLIRAV